MLSMLFTYHPYSSTYPSARLVMLLRDPVRRALSGFSHNCRHKRYVRTLRALDMLVDVDGDMGAVGTAPGPGGSSNGTVNSGPGKGLPWPLLLEQFGVHGNGSRGDARRRRLLVPAGTVLQLRDLLALRALSAAAAAAAPAQAPSSSTSPSSMWSDASAASPAYRTLSYPCSADDFRDYYFGAAGRADIPPPPSRGPVNSTSTAAPAPALAPASVRLAGGAVVTAPSGATAAAAAATRPTGGAALTAPGGAAAWRVSAFAAEEAAAGHYAAQLAWVREFFPRDQVRVGGCVGGGWGALCCCVGDGCRRFV